MGALALFEFALPSLGERKKRNGRVQDNAHVCVCKRAFRTYVRVRAKRSIFRHRHRPWPGCAGSTSAFGRACIHVDTESFSTMRYCVTRVLVSRLGQSRGPACDAIRSADFL